MQACLNVQKSGWLCLYVFLGLNVHEKTSRLARFFTYKYGLSVGLGFGFGQLAVFVGVKAGKFGDVVVHACGFEFGQ